MSWYLGLVCVSYLNGTQGSIRWLPPSNHFVPLRDDDILFKKKHILCYLDFVGMSLGCASVVEKVPSSGLHPQTWGSSGSCRGWGWGCSAKDLSLYSLEKMRKVIWAQTFRASLYNVSALTSKAKPEKELWWHDGNCLSCNPYRVGAFLSSLQLYSTQLGEHVWNMRIEMVVGKD